MLLVGRSQPDLGEGHELVLPGRGTTYCHTVQGDPNSPTIVLIHGWTATAEINFGRAVHALDGMNIVALDMRGHGRGIHGSKVCYPGGKNYLEANADDIAAAMDLLGIDKAIVAGYSMGTAIAQLMWKRHPGRVQGLVLCAGAAQYPQVEKLSRPFAHVDTYLQHVPCELRRTGAHVTNLGLFRGVPLLHETGRNDPLIFVQAGLAIEKFDSRPWAGRIDVPTAVIITEKDRFVPKPRQDALLAAIPGAKGYYASAGHLDGAFAPEFAPQLGAAVQNVADRSWLALGAPKKGLAVA